MFAEMKKDTYEETSTGPANPVDIQKSYQHGYVPFSTMGSQRKVKLCAAMLRHGRGRDKKDCRTSRSPTEATASSQDMYRNSSGKQA